MEMSRKAAVTWDVLSELKKKKKKNKRALGLFLPPS